jgi:hypothetical protein
MFVALAIAVASLDIATVSATVRAAPTISDRLVEEALHEADAIWRSNGVAVVWQTSEDTAASTEGSLSVMFDDGKSTLKDSVGTLGTIVFAGGVPLPYIRLSYSNALELLRERYGGALNQMTLAERRRHVSRALGRALAHELGHYMLASREHTAHGLMKALQTTDDLFGPSRRPFELTDAQRCEVLGRLRSGELLAPR